MGTSNSQAHAALSRGLTGYQGAIERSYAPMEIAPASPGRRFAWAVDGRRCGALGFTRIYARGAVRARLPESPGDGNFILTYVQGGAFEFEQDGRHAVCDTNSLVLMNATRSLEAAQGGLADLLSIVIPASLLRCRLPAIDEFCTRAIPASAGASAMLRDLMQSSWRERDWFAQPASAVLPGMLVNLLQPVFAETTTLSAPPRVSLHHQALKAVIERELRNPDLSPDLIAAELGMSRSYLFALTRQLGTTVRRLIIETRLDACRAALGDPSWAGFTITELALAFGFQDQAHFSRRFTARFGMAPRTCRARRDAPLR